MLGGGATSGGAGALDPFCGPPMGLLPLPSLETEDQLQEYLFSVLPEDHARQAQLGHQLGVAINPSTTTDTDTSTPLHAEGPSLASLEHFGAVMGGPGEADSAMSPPGKTPSIAAPPLLGAAAPGSAASPQPDAGVLPLQHSLVGNFSAQAAAAGPLPRSISEAAAAARAEPASPPRQSPSRPSSPSLAFAGLSSTTPRQHILVTQQPGVGSPLAFLPGRGLPSGFAGYPAPCCAEPPPPSSAAVAASIMPLPLAPPRNDAASGPSAPSAPSAPSTTAATSGDGASLEASPAGPSRLGAGPSRPSRGKAAATKETANTAVIPNPESLSKQELRRLRRMISNRESARRSRKRKQEQLGDLEEEARMAQAAAAGSAARAAHLEAELAVRDSQIAALRQEVETLRHLLLLRNGYAPSC